MSFQNIKFGYASAEKESAEEPLLLLEGYLDTEDVIREAKMGSKFLFLGYKGSGKSAIGEHIKLTAQDDSNLFVNATYLSDFPFTDFGKIIVGDSEPESKYPTAWSWLLLLNLFDSFSRDNGAHLNNNSEFFYATEALKNMGLLPTPDLRQVVLASSKRSFKLKLPQVLETGFEKNLTEQGLQLPFFVERLKVISRSFKSESKHLLIIDGLDDILSYRDIQYRSLAALVLEVTRLNLMFRSNGTPAKIILLCRTDLFERLPGANKNKIRQDSATILDWYHDPRQPEDSNLIKLINRRSKLSDPSVSDTFQKFFPNKFDGKEIKSSLLDLTRHTPRDFIQLLVHIQKFAKGDKVSNDQMLSGIRDYSINYFIPEIMDELAGYVDVNSISVMFQLLGSMRKREFYVKELFVRAEEQSNTSQLDLPSILNALFECSAIGNAHNRPTGSAYFTFKYRNRNSSLGLKDRIILHRGMWKAMNLV